MASFEFSGFYQVERDVNGNFFVDRAFSFYPVTVSNNLPSDVIKVNQQVDIDGDAGDSTNVVAAITSYGIIAFDSDLGYYTLYSNEQELTEDTVLDVTPTQYPVCFVKGTLIDTVRGPVPIEALTIGDKVMGSTGLRTVKWIGWRHYHAVALQTRAQRVACTPVRILAHALGDNQPSQDLRVSPWHHLYIDGVLVRANDLLNGKSIVQEIQVEEFSYYHVELDQFDVIRAHGVYSESWADGGNRDFFQNVDVTTLRPEDQKRRMADRPGFTALRRAPDIALIYARLAARADELFSVPWSQAA